MIYSGQAVYRLALQAPASPTYDTAGQEVEDWEEVRSVWAKIVPNNSTEKTLADGLEAQTSYAITLRYWPDVKHDWRGEWGERVLRFASVIHDDYAQETRLVAVEVE